MNTKSPHLDPDWLRQKYEGEQLSTYDIAAIVHRDPKRIYEKLREFGIPTRPRGHNLHNDVSSDNYQLQPGALPTFKGRHHTEAAKRLLSKKASRPKPYLRGVNNGMAGRKGPDNPHYKHGRTPERQRVYASWEWHAAMREVYARDGDTCIRCGTSKAGRRTIHVHHVIAWRKNHELRISVDNLVTLCRPCHSWVHSKANTERDFMG